MISEKMYANHRAQNFLMSEKKRHRDEKFHNNARRYKDIASRNCYAVNRQQAKGGK